MDSVYTKSPTGTYPLIFSLCSQHRTDTCFYLEDLRGIPLQKDVNKSFMLEYMSKDAITTVLRQPDPSKKIGIRDLFFLVLMYDSAARDCEMLSMRFVILIR